MPRFVILRHESPRGLHFDFMLEVGDVLKTWALPRLPEAGEEMACESLADHRPEYLDYEGPVSGGRGSVVRQDRGTYLIVRESESQLAVELSGEQVTGRATVDKKGDTLLFRFR